MQDESKLQDIWSGSVSVFNVILLILNIIGGIVISESVYVAIWIAILSIGIFMLVLFLCEIGSNMIKISKKIDELNKRE